MFKVIRLMFVTIPFILISYPLSCIYTWRAKKISKKRRFRLARVIIKACNVGFGAKVKIENREYFDYDGNVVFYGNHQSEYDILAIISKSKLPISALSKQEVRKYPFVGRISYYIDCTYLNRDSLKDMAKVINKTTKLVADGHRFFIFPEGTRTKSPTKEIAEFKPGAFKVAINAQATIIPFAIDGATTVMDIKTKIKHTVVTIRFAKPLLYQDYSHLSATELSEKVAAIVAENYQLIRKKV